MTIRPHTSRTSAVALDLQNDRAFSASDDGSICVWDIRSRVHSILHGHAAAVSCLAVEASGTRLVSGSADTTVRVWNLTSGMSCVFRGHEEEITCICIDQSGRRAVSGAKNGAVRVWDLETGRGRLISPKVDPDSGILRFRTEDGLNSLLIEEHGSPVEHLILDRPALQGLSWSQGDRALRLWDLESGSCRELGETDARRSRPSDVVGTHSLATDSGFPRAIAAAGSGLGGGIRVWDLVDGTCRDLCSQGSSHAHALAYDPISQQLASGSSDGVFRLWDLSRNPTQGEPENILNSISCVALDPSGRRGVFSGGGGAVGTWLAEPGHIRYYKADHFNVRALTVDRHAHRAATVDVNGKLRVWDLLRSRSQRVELSETECTCAAIDPSGELVVVGSRDGVLRVWHHGSRFRRILGRHAASICRVALDAVGTRAIAASEDGEIRLWNLRNATSQLLEPNPVSIRGWHRTGGVAFDAEVASVAMVWWEKWIRVWDIDLGRWTLLEVLTSSISCAQVNGRSGNVVFGTADGWIRSWNAQDRQVSLLGRHDGRDGITAIAPIWELGLVASTSNDASIRIWSIHGPAGDRVNRPKVRFSNDLEANFTALAAREKVLIAGDSDGRVHCFRLEGVGH